MNPSPRTQPVSVCLGVEVREKAVTIRPIEPDIFELVLDDGMRAATCRSSVALANWAWSQGVLKVVHDFDLRFSR